jgi:hypothetical protein
VRYFFTHACIVEVGSALRIDDLESQATLGSISFSNGATGGFDGSRDREESIILVSTPDAQMSKVPRLSFGIRMQASLKFAALSRKYAATPD